MDSRRVDRPCHLTREAPVVVDDRVEHLIEILAVTEERLPQEALLHGAQLSAARRCRGRSGPPTRASSRCTPSVSNANSSTSSAPSWNTPVPQNGEPIAKPHSAVPNPGSVSRIWKMPIAVSYPFSVTAKHA